MSTGLIIVIVVAALVLLGLLATLPRMRRGARLKQRERELGQRREAVVSEHREQAGTHDRQAETAEQRARIAEQEARREREEAQLLREKATVHERGMADHELVEDHERQRFAGTSAVPESSTDDAGNRSNADDATTADHRDGERLGAGDQSRRNVQT